MRCESSAGPSRGSGRQSGPLSGGGSSEHAAAAATRLSRLALLATGHEALERLCVFCGAPAGSHEHLLPKWLQKVLPSAEKVTHFVEIGRDPSERREGIAVRFEKGPGSSATAATRTG